MSRLYRWVLLLALSIAGVLRGQQMDSPDTVPVIIICSATPASAATVISNGQSGVTGLIAVDLPGQHIDTAPYTGHQDILGNLIWTKKVNQISTGALTTQCKPGIDSVLWVKGRFSNYVLNVIPPDGYTAYVEGQMSQQITCSNLQPTSGWESPITRVIFRVEKSVGKSAVLKAGECTDLKTRGNSFSIGLGYLANGVPAGAISFDWFQKNLWNRFMGQGYVNEARRSDDIKIVDNPTPECTVQIIAPQCVITVYRSDMWHQRIQCHRKSDVALTPLSSGIYQANGAPFVEYFVESNINGNYCESIRVTKINNVGGGSLTTWTQVDAEYDETYYNSGVKRYYHETCYSWNNSQVSPFPEINNVVDSVVEWDRSDTDATGCWTELFLTKGPTGVVNSCKKTYKNFDWGPELISTADGDDAHTTNLSYHTDVTSGGYTRLSSVLNPDGSWVRYDYCTYDPITEVPGKLYAVYKPFLDAPAKPYDASLLAGDVSVFTYTADNLGNSDLIQKVVHTINGIQVGRTDYDYTYETINGMNAMVKSEKVWTDPSNFQTTVTRLYANDAGGMWPGLIHSIRRPDGTIQLHSYVLGTWSNNTFTPATSASTSSGDLRHDVVEGISANISSGGVVMSDLLNGFQTVPSDFRVILGRSTAESTVTSAGVGVVASTKSFYGSTQAGYGWVAYQQQFTNYQDGTPGYVSSIFTPDNTIQSIQYIGGQVTCRKGADGITSYFQYDGLGRENYSRREGIATQPGGGDLYKLTQHNAHGDTLTTTVSSSPIGGKADDIVTSYFYDLGGRCYMEKSTEASLINRVPCGTLATKMFKTCTLSDPNPLLNIVSQKDGTTLEEERYLDGRIKRKGGTGRVSTYYYYFLNSDGTLTTQTSLAPVQNPNSNQTPDGWKNESVDWAGRTLSVSSPAYSADKIIETFTYDANGHLVRKDLISGSGISLRAPVLYSYSAMGDLHMECLNFSGSGVINVNGSAQDRITGYQTFIDQTNGEYRMHRVASLYQAPTTMKVSTMPGQFITVYIPNISRISEEVTTICSLEARGMSEFYVVDLLHGTKQISRRTLCPSARQVTTTSTTSDSSTPASSTIINGLLASQISKSGVKTTFSYDENGRLQKTEGRMGDFEFYEYYPGTTHIFRLSNQYLQAASWCQWHIFQYDMMGRVIAHGINNCGQDETKYYEYTAQGNLLHQWGPGAQPLEYKYNAYGQLEALSQYRAAGSTKSVTWPVGNLGSPDITRWLYQGETGLCTQKDYPLRGDLSGEEVASVKFSYNKRNQLYQRTWPDNRITTYKYGNEVPGEANDALLRSVTYDDGTPSVTFSYNAAIGHLNTVSDAIGTRSFTYNSTDFQLASEQLSSSFYGTSSTLCITHRYQTASNGVNGRYAGFNTGTVSSPMAIQSINYGYDATTGRVQNVVGVDNFKYGYEQNTDWITTVATGDPASPIFQRKMQWATWRQSVDVCTTKWTGDTIQQQVYDNDWHGDRWRQTESGRYYASAAHGQVSTYPSDAYKRMMYYHQNPANADASINYDSVTKSISRDWTYDGAGNRSSDTSYAASSSTLTTNEWVSNGRNQVTTLGYALAPLSISYDQNGNISTDANWTYVYDGENRLHTMKASASNTSPVKGLRFTYDYLGRRVRKETFSDTNFDTTAIGETPRSDIRFLWNDFNLIAELDALHSFGVIRSYVWGLDKSGVLQGDGGVGGLLMICKGGSNYYPLVDAAGNVTGLLDSSGGIVEKYSMNSFGEPDLAKTQDLVIGNPFRFASKYLDVETGLYQYNYRYYNPALGRFISSDPIAENGGVNLYSYCGSDPANQADFLGMLYDGWINSEDNYYEDIPIEISGGSSSIFTWEFYYFNNPIDIYFSGKNFQAQQLTGLNTSGRYGQSISASGNKTARKSLPPPTPVTKIQPYRSAPNSGGSFMGQVAGAGVGFVSEATGWTDSGNAAANWRQGNYGTAAGWYVLGTIKLSMSWTGIGGVMGRVGRFADSLLAAESGAARALRLPATDAGLAGTETLGYTRPNGSVFLRPGLSRAEQISTLRHEAVHAWFSPRGNSPLATFRQGLGQWGYDNSQLLRFTEEAIAETYASRSLLQGIRHPLMNGYGITPSGLLFETGLFGGGVVGGAYLIGTERKP